MRTRLPLPNLAGVSLPDAALVAAIWKNGFNIVILQEEEDAPEWVIDQPRSRKQREVKDIKQENAATAGRGLSSLVYGCSCA